MKTYVLLCIAMYALPSEPEPMQFRRLPREAATDLYDAAVLIFDII